ncbi:MAG: TIR domain-containing protein [Thiolinea sp.]
MADSGEVSVQRTVFVSYARKDSEPVQHAVALLEAGGAQVFRDIDDIAFGDQWEDVITRKLQECERVMVFWSRNASESEWVGKEYGIALTQKKRLVPVLLDSTPLPPELSKYHALTNFMPKRPLWKRYGGWMVGGLAVTALAGVIALPVLQQSSAPVDESLVVNSPPEEPDSGGDQADIPPIADLRSTDAIRPAPRPAPLIVPETTTSGQSIPKSAGSATGNINYNVRPYSHQQSPASNYYPGAPDPKANTSPPAATAVEPSVSVPADPSLPQAAPASDADDSFVRSPLFIWGGVVLALLVLLLLWFRKKRVTSDLIADSEVVAGKKFVEMVFDEHA